MCIGPDVEDAASRRRFVYVDLAAAARDEDFSITPGTALGTGLEADTDAVAVEASNVGMVRGCAGDIFTNALPAGTGFAIDFGSDAFGVGEDLTWVAVGALAKKVEAAAGEAVFLAPRCFFFVVAIEGAGVG